MKERELILVSGPNGAGKTTLALAYAQQFGFPYLGADQIAASLCPADPTSKRIEAGRRFLIRVADTIKEGTSVVVESTLSGVTFARTLDKAREADFSVLLVHLFLDSPETCIARVDERVKKGGHDVPESDIRRRYRRSAANFWRLYRPYSNRWVLMYNSAPEAQTIAEGDAQTHAGVIASCSKHLCSLLTEMIDRTSSKDESDRIDVLVQLGRKAVRDAQQQSRELGVANVYSLNGRLYYELPSGELSLSPPDSDRS